MMFPGIENLRKNLRHNGASKLKITYVDCQEIGGPLAK